MINDDLRKGTITENEAKSIRSKLLAIINNEREAFDVLYKNIKDVNENNMVESKYLPTAKDVNVVRKELKKVIECILDHEFQPLPDMKKKRKTSTTTGILIHYDICCSPEEYVPAYRGTSNTFTREER